MRLAALIFYILFLPTVITFAQTDTDIFTVQVQIGIDTTPPSTPTLLSATPVAATQIDLSWSTSTDDFAVSGYSVLRDSVPIATTSLLIYSDTSLTASTTYTYAVRAFDTSIQYSSTSNSIATTTLSVPAPTSTPPTETERRKEGTISRVVVDDLTIATGISTTTFSLLTAHFARVELRWGRSVSYELGYVVSDVYSKEHTILLTELEPGTTYEYEITGYTPAGFRSILKRGSFTTQSSKSLSLPSNVGRFLAVGAGDDVTLSWDLPPSDSIATVRVVRSHLGFPTHPQDGAIVYQGLGGSVRDEGILAKYSPVYYTAFVYDIYGNVSSGAIAVVYANAAPSSMPSAQPTVPTKQPPSDSGSTQIGTTDKAISTIKTERVTAATKMPELSDVLLTQDELTFYFSDPEIALDAHHAFSVSIPTGAVAGNLKSIIATFIDPTDNRDKYSFLLRVNKDRTAYEAQIPPLSVVGKSQVMVEIYDYEAYVVGTYQTPIYFKEAVVPVVEEVTFPDVFFRYGLYVLAGLGVVLVLVFILLLVKRIRSEDNP